ncbi:MAG: hypothetical protein AAB778_01750, partial [Patescibacteria group bacterium]
KMAIVITNKVEKIPPKIAKIAARILAAIFAKELFIRSIKLSMSSKAFNPKVLKGGEIFSKYSGKP